MLRAVLAAVAATDRRNDGVVSDTARDKAERMFKLGQKEDEPHGPTG